MTPRSSAAFHWVRGRATAIGFLTSRSFVIITTVSLITLLIVIDYPIWGTVHRTPRTYFCSGTLRLSDGDYTQALYDFIMGSQGNSRNNRVKELYKISCFGGSVVAAESLKQYSIALQMMDSLYKYTTGNTEYLDAYKQQLIDAARPNEGRNLMTKEKKWQTN
jgi:hypothetical protein